VRRLALTRLAALGTLSRSAGEGGPGPHPNSPPLAGEGQGGGCVGEGDGCIVEPAIQASTARRLRRFNRTAPRKMATAATMIGISAMSRNSSPAFRRLMLLRSAA